jgi:hypothetical protein
MKNAKLKLTEEEATARGLKLIERDRMPAEVATDYLCILPRIGNPERKKYMDARVRVFCATAEKKPAGVMLSARAKSKTLVQLGRGLRRSARKRRGLQRRYEAAIRLPEGPLKQRRVSGLDMMAAMIDQVSDSILNELDRRRDL